MTAATMPALRPLGLGEILDQAIRLYRRNFARFIGIIAIVQIPLVLIQLIASAISLDSLLVPLSQPGGPQTPEEIFTPGYFAGISASFLISIISVILVQGVATAALTRAIADSRLGESTGIFEAYSKIGRTWLRLLGAILLSALIFIGLIIWFLIPCIGWLTGLGMLAFFGAAVGPLVAPIIVLENKGVVESIRRAWDLARRRFWWILGFVFILYLLNQIIITGPTALITGALELVLDNTMSITQQTIIRTVIQSLSGLILSLVYLPLQLTAITLMYFDLRVRTEGFDLALQTEDPSGVQAGITALLSKAPPAESGNLVTAAELGNFLLLSVGAAMLYGILVGILAILGALLVSASGAGGL